MAWLNKNHLKLYYETHGKGPAVLMIAGLASDSQSWQFILKKMASRFNVIIYDNRGTGRTQNASYPFLMKDLAQDALDLLDHLGVNQCQIVGHSMGGCIAQELAFMAPEMVNKMVLASTTSIMSDRNKSLFDHFIHGWESGIPQDQWFRELFYWLFSPSAFVNKKFLDAAIIYTMCYPYQQTLESFKSQIEALVQFDSSPFLEKIHTKSLIVSGSKDILVYPDESAKLKSMPGFHDMIILEKAAHSIHAEYPEEFLDCIFPFLEN